MLDTAGVQTLLRRAAAAIIGCLLALALMTSLVLAGFYLLLRALTLALMPFLGEAGALAVTGLVCLCLVGGVILLMMRPAKAPVGRSSPSAKGSLSPVSQLRKLIRDNPLESAMTAFALGVVEQGDPRLRSLLLQGGMVLMKQAETGDPPSEAGDAPPPTD